MQPSDVSFKTSCKTAAKIRIIFQSPKLFPFFFGKVLIFYHIGVMASFLSCQAFGLKGSWIALIPVCTAMLLVLEESGSKVKVLPVGTAQVWIKNGVQELHMK